MLLDTKISIEVTNDGIDNKVKMNFNTNQKLIDVITSLQLAQQDLKTYFTAYIKQEHGIVTEKKAEEIIQNIKFNEIFNIPIENKL